MSCPTRACDQNTQRTVECSRIEATKLMRSPPQASPLRSNKSRSEASVEGLRPRAGRRLPGVDRVHVPELRAMRTERTGSVFATRSSVAVSASGLYSGTTMSRPPHVLNAHLPLINTRLLIMVYFSRVIVLKARIKKAKGMRSPAIQR